MNFVITISILKLVSFAINEQMSDWNNFYKSLNIIK